MDDIPENMESIDIQSNFEDLYKNRSRPGSQESRRQELLEQQKRNRYMVVDKYRSISSASSNSTNGSRKDVPYRYRPALSTNGVEVNYKNILMFSEWMEEKPHDFEDKWLMVPCPKGRRMFLIAKDGYTSFYTKSGKFNFEVPTGLPGGNRLDYNKNERCVLDGVYVRNTNKFYILDVMVWNNHELFLGQTEYRHFWLESYLEYNSNCTEIRRNNEVIFSVLPKISCDIQSMSEYLEKYPPFHNNNPELDGFLFYHRFTFYSRGHTPLVGWLLSFMIPEVLGEDITVHPNYLTKPKDYKDQATFIAQYEVLHRNKKRTYLNPENYYCLSPEPQEYYFEYIMTNNFLLTKPENLETNYFVVPIPKAIKMMAVSHEGNTRFYNKYGFLEFELETTLPGGNHFYEGSTPQLCILDGYYDKSNKTFYILDMLGWNHFDMYSAEAECRNNWLHQNLDVYPEIRQLTHLNTVIFHVLPRLSAKQEDLIAYLTKYPAFEGGYPELDLLAFIEKGQKYVPGENLSVLHPFMIPEVFGCQYMVHKEYMKAKPGGYSNRYAYVQANYEEKVKELRNCVTFLNKLKKKRTPQIFSDPVCYTMPSLQNLKIDAKKQNPISILKEITHSNSVMPSAWYTEEYTCRSHVSDEKLSENSFEQNNYFHLYRSPTPSPVNDINGMDISNLDEEVAAVMGEDANAVMGEDANAVMGEEANTVMGEEANAVMGEEANAVMGKEANAVMGKEANADQSTDVVEEIGNAKPIKDTEPKQVKSKDEETDSKEGESSEVTESNKKGESSKDAAAMEVVKPSKAAEVTKAATVGKKRRISYEHIPKKPKYEEDTENK